MSALSVDPELSKTFSLRREMGRRDERLENPSRPANLTEPEWLNQRRHHG
jgi:hypothetical protein